MDIPPSAVWRGFGFAALIAGLAVLWWPDARYQPIRADEKWTLPQAVDEVRHAGTERQSGADAAGFASPDPAASDRPGGGSSPQPGSPTPAVETTSPAPGTVTEAPRAVPGIAPPAPTTAANAGATPTTSADAGATPTPSTSRAGTRSSSHDRGAATNGRPDDGANSDRRRAAGARHDRAAAGGNVTDGGGAPGPDHDSGAPAPASGAEPHRPGGDHAMIHFRTITRPLVPLLAFVTVLLPIEPARAAEDDPPADHDNIALAYNVEDGSVLFELAFSVRRVSTGTIDHVNVAAALGSCADCTTVAVAFQAVLAKPDVEILAPLNVAVAANDGCVGCFTYASATQVVLSYDRNVRITGRGRQRLHDVERFLRYLQEHAAELAPGQLVAAVNAAEIEFMAIMAEEVVSIGRPHDLQDTASAPPAAAPAPPPAPPSEATPAGASPETTVPPAPDPSADTTLPLPAPAPAPAPASATSEPAASAEPATTTVVPPAPESSEPSDPPAASEPAGTEPAASPPASSTVETSPTQPIDP